MLHSTVQGITVRYMSVKCSATWEKSSPNGRFLTPKHQKPSCSEAQPHHLSQKIQPALRRQREPLLSGMKKTLNSELWHACAGPLVSLPQVGSLVYYFPQGHSEQVAFLTKGSTNIPIPDYPNLPSQLLCQVHNVTLHSDKDTDEIYAQMTLQPVNTENGISSIQNSRHKRSKYPNDFFFKTLTASDTSTHGGFSIPRRAAEKLFPPLDYNQQPPTQELVVKDLHDNSWTFRHIYRGQPRRHLLTTGWSLFLGAKRLRAGDSVLFIRDENSQLLLGVRRSSRQQTVLSSAMLSAESMHMGVLAAAAHAASNRSLFTVFYNPGACPSGFVIPLEKYHKSVHGTQVSVGMRFGMMFETEESSKRRFMGTVVGISDLDPIGWPNSKWRNVEVEWDEHGIGERLDRVSLWEIETLDCPFICPTSTSVSHFKRQLPFAFPDYGSWQYDVKRFFGPFTGRASHSLNQNLGSKFMNALASSLSIVPDPPIELMEASILQTLRNAELHRSLPSTLSNLSDRELGIPALQLKANQESLAENPLSQNQITHTWPKLLPFYNPNLTSELEKHVADNLVKEFEYEEKKLDAQDEHDEKPENGHSIQTGQQSPNITTAVAEKSPYCMSLEKCTEEKSIFNQESPQKIFDQVYSNQESAVLSEPLLETNLSPLLSFTNDHFSPCVDADDCIMQFGCQPITGVFMSPKALIAPYKSGPSFLSPSADGSILLDPTPMGNVEMTSTVESLHIPSSLAFSGSQEQACLQQLTCPRFYSGLRDIYEGSINESEAYSGLQFEADASVSQSGLEAFCSVRNTKVQNLTDFPSEFCNSSQDIQSQITSASLSSCLAFPMQEIPEKSGGISSSHGEGDVDFMQQGSLHQISPPLRTYTKVQKLGSVGRSIDVTRFHNYDELRCALACMFGLQGQLDDPRGSAWKLVYVDYENDVLLVGDDPWEEFVICVRCIRILSPSEIEKMSEEGIQILNRTNVLEQEILA